MQRTSKTINDFDSFWEWSKTKSSYHFDSFRQDAPNSTFRVITTLPVTWADELLSIKSKAFSTTWNNVTRTGGIDQKVTAIDKRGQDIAYGGGNIDNLELTDVTDDFTDFTELKKIIDSFNLKSALSRCHTQKTGQMFTTHIDPLQRTYYKDGNGDVDLVDYGYDVLDIVRITVMLEDWVPGQFVIYGNTVYQQWKAGETIIHDWPNIPHATANASERSRSTLQVTGLRTEKTDPRYDVRNFYKS